MRQFKNLVGPYCFWLFVLTIVPMLLIVMYAFMEKGNTITTFNFTLDNFGKFIDPVFISVLMKSFVLGIVTTIICLLLGYPVAYAISKCKEGSQTLLILLITFPTWINLLMKTYAWISLLSNKGIINNMLDAMGFSSVNMLYTDFAVVLGMVYNFLPFMILPIYTVLEKMDKSLLEAAEDLGATKTQAFWKITFPMSLSGVITGIIMVFIPAISTFEISALLGGNKINLVGNVIENQFRVVGDWNYGSAISMVLMVIILVIMSITNKFDDNDEKTGGGLW